MSLLLLVTLLASPAPDTTCTYRTYAWDVKQRRGVGHRTVTKARDALTAQERDPGEPRCTVCREDQETVKVDGIPPFRVCRLYAAGVTAALKAALSKGFVVEKVTGYRVGRTRGKVVDSKRTQFSNHSYGTAVDVNARQNGMYNRCRLARPAAKAADVARCRLGMGGAWDPKRRPKRTIVRGGPLHQAFAAIPWRWGGDLPSALKDFMHFSLTGE